MKDKRYEKVVKDLYIRMMEAIKQSEKWDWPDVIGTRFQYHIKAVTFLELLESVTVFHVGLGFDRKSQQFNKRVESFKFLESKK